ncbi:PRC-barrel domain containing protein [Starkeya sp. 3C]|uniref:PRC-barrel domain containing protein n=1 Tax=Ancylobacter moscoviensis TaxID=2597768 RepID=A0ABY3DWU6_9HYPH|nr:PRC-barrel domain-containing protein [Ancylobacter moscoviensis]TSJ64649.1 PRC-barrel domain containing protein [Ancylobacter moscoviensis]
MTRTFATLTAAAALMIAPATFTSMAQAQSPSPETTTPPAASPVMPDAGTPQAPPAEMPNSPSTDTPSAAPDAMPGDTTQASPTVVPATPKFVATQESGQQLGSDLIGADVVTSTDEKLGSIRDVVVERDGRIIAAVIDVGGFLGIGAKPVAVSFDSLAPTTTDSGQKIVVALTKEELNTAPEFKTLEQVRQETSDAGARTN